MGAVGLASRRVRGNRAVSMLRSWRALGGKSPPQEKQMSARKSGEADNDK